MISRILLPREENMIIHVIIRSTEQVTTHIKKRDQNLECKIKTNAKTHFGLLLQESSSSNKWHSNNSRGLGFNHDTKSTVYFFPMLLILEHLYFSNP